MPSPECNSELLQPSRRPAAFGRPDGRRSHNRPSRYRRSRRLRIEQKSQACCDDETTEQNRSPRRLSQAQGAARSSRHNENERGQQHDKGDGGGDHAAALRWSMSFFMASWRACSRHILALPRPGTPFVSHRKTVEGETPSSWDSASRDGPFRFSRGCLRGLPLGVLGLVFIVADLSITERLRQL